jgi:phospholipid transport system substrate-binding protein
LNATERPRRTCWHALAIATIAGHLAASVAIADERTPEEVISTTAVAVARTIAARKRELQVSTTKLHAVADELLLPQFDFKTASQLILREHWNTATAEQRQRFVEDFYRFLLSAHASALLEFRHDTVTVLPPSTPASGTSARVATVLKLNDDSRHHVDFYMRRTAAGWKIVDIIVEGVSYVRTYRTDFGAEIRAHGLDALLNRLEHEASRGPNGGADTPR